MSLDQPTSFVKHQTITRDAFLGGRLTLSQPAHGFRAGLDSVLLGAAVSHKRKCLLDLGSGVGTAGLVALAHNPGLDGTLAEIDPAMLALAQANIDENSFSDRARAIPADIAAKGSERIAAGLMENAFDTIIANPPFFDDAAGTRAQNQSRAGARHMDKAALDAWAKTAATCGAAGAEIIFIYPAAGLAPLLAAFAQRFGAITILPLTPRPDAPASRVLLRAIKGSRAPLTLLASRALHPIEGRAFAPEFDLIFRGKAVLVW
jgi:tRNA1(Val) A37 N6-methylase TrmN6